MKKQVTKSASASAALRRTVDMLVVQFVSSCAALMAGSRAPSATHHHRHAPAACAIDPFLVRIDPHGSKVPHFTPMESEVLRSITSKIKDAQQRLKECQHEHECLVEEVSTLNDQISFLVDQASGKSGGETMKARISAMKRRPEVMKRRAEAREKVFEVEEATRQLESMRDAQIATLKQHLGTTDDTMGVVTPISGKRGTVTSDDDCDDAYDDDCDDDCCSIDI